jgi:uncharacterized membrane protein YgdD (TMEM256/DUF423 family)
MTTERLFAAIGAASGFLAVAAGAFGAHALRARLSPHLIDVFETGARYQMYHALALLAVALLAGRWQAPQLAWAGWLFIAGTLLFCGSLYLLALTDVPWWGAVTPVGGVAFLAGWLLVAWAAATRV